MTSNASMIGKLLALGAQRCKLQVIFFVGCPGQGKRVDLGEEGKGVQQLRKIIERWVYLRFWKATLPPMIH